jgi:hypothetical protein
MYVCTQATYTGKKVIYLGPTMGDFQQRIGISTSTGGKNGSLRPTKDQLMRLTASHLQLHYITPGLRYSMMHAAPPIKQFDFWFADGIHEVNHWDGVISLDDEFFRCLMDGNMPLRAEAIAALQNSPMALDIYSWLAFRLWRIKVSPMKPLPWETLQAQFGPEYARIRDFRGAFKEKLALVRTVYPEARIEFDTNGELVLYRSKPPVPRKVVIEAQKIIKFPVSL